MPPDSSGDLFSGSAASAFRRVMAIPGHGDGPLTVKVWATSAIDPIRSYSAFAASGATGRIAPGAAPPRPGRGGGGPATSGPLVTSTWVACFHAPARTASSASPNSPSSPQTFR